MGSLIKAAAAGSELTKAPKTGDPAGNGRPATLALRLMQGNPENPRPADLDVSDTAASMALHGQLHNVNVMTLQAFVAAKPHLKDELTAAPYVVVNGNCRLLAAPKAGLKALRYELRDEWTADDIDLALIAENVHRQDLNPMLVGRRLALMLERPVYGGAPGKPGRQEDLAAAIGKSKTWVNQRIALTKLQQPLQDAVEAGTVSWTVAREAKRLADELQPLLASGELPEDLAQQWLVRDRISKDEQRARWAAGPPYTGQEYDVFRDGDEQPAAAAVNGSKPAPGEQPERERKAPPAVYIRLDSYDRGALADALSKSLEPGELKLLAAELTKRVVERPS